MLSKLDAPRVMVPSHYGMRASREQKSASRISIDKFLYDLTRKLISFALRAKKEFTQSSRFAFHLSQVSFN